MKPHIVIISPYLAKANNGNWLTASRWAHFLRKHYRVSIALEWDGAPCDAMIALHARRSFVSIVAFAAAQPATPLIVVLTGTDLYRDIHTDSNAQRSLQLATQLVVLQPEGLNELDAGLRSKTQVIYQSTPSLKPVSQQQKRKARYFDVTMIGHLRAEKDPLTFMRATALIKTPRVRLLHIGGALDPLLGAQAEATQNSHPNYRWLGHLVHTDTRQRLKRSHLMVITSVMEGGAHVIIEAVTSGVPVLASDISGNRGMLGANYAGYFPLGNSVELARLIDLAANDEAFYSLLLTQCAARAPLFTPEHEKSALLKLADHCIKEPLIKSI
ncbi:MAG: selenoneine biosynthesis selenosugar synthase SenB [Gallionellaceae bacterium]|jgi:putative glycosyltransferase (TIGR04348 family)